VRLGTGPRCRVGWVEQEVEDWLQERIQRRDTPTDDSPTVK
jgi:predicted DNA-binding transcriptional regulator AlpA